MGDIKKLKQKLLSFAGKTIMKTDGQFNIKHNISNLPRYTDVDNGVHFYTENGILLSMYELDDWKIVEPDEQPKDHINKPSHYNSGEIEPIDAIEDWNLDFRLANVVKYIARAGKKDGEEISKDLKKSFWYLARFLLKKKIVTSDELIKTIEYLKGRCNETKI